MDKKQVSGIIVSNPVNVEKDYLKKIVDYAKKEGINHIQVVGPIHDYLHGNLDGMTEYVKYSKFNEGKDMPFIKKTKEAFSYALADCKKAGIKVYVWHHELDLPNDFGKEYPECLNSDLDFEVTHPIIKDFLENRLVDFFNQYPTVDGIILTLHETKVPLLKLKNQVLTPTERVKYVTKILYDGCKALGKELIVRPFASIPEDYTMMMNAYADISHDLVVMDKWTQFDWSLCLPSNAFFKEIKYNPLVVETDIFGEYFGKGRLPIMLLEHIKDKVAYCEKFTTIGYASRIDREGLDPFDEVNEVNLSIMTALTHNEDPSKAADLFFETKYPGVGKEIREIMNPTEEILRKITWLNGYYFSELSFFPSLNHSKNHFYFEMMKDNYEITSGEWFIPKDWERGPLENVIIEKEEALNLAKRSLKKLESIKDKIAPADYDNIHLKFVNLCMIAEIWKYLAETFIHYTKFFEKEDKNEEKLLNESLKSLCKMRDKGRDTLGNLFYCFIGEENVISDLIGDFVDQVKKSFEAEKASTTELKAKDPIDYIVCAGGCEGHKLKKEVNFSDTHINDDGTMFRVPGPLRVWSVVNAHGWFSYEIKVNESSDTNIFVTAGSLTDNLHMKVTIDGIVNEVHDTTNGSVKTYNFKHKANGKNAVVVRIDRLTADTPCLYNIYSK